MTDMFSWGLLQEVSRARAWEWCCDIIAPASWWKGSAGREVRLARRLLALLPGRPSLLEMAARACSSSSLVGGNEA